ncbi:MAG: PP2C family protein-serine/threonine phosphatase [Lachnospiraceae bacterium]|nr:PP2C family protein-serine/threonine phosphatase [Lachnospiraceae bacterium]
MKKHISIKYKIGALLFLVSFLVSCGSLILGLYTFDYYIMKQYSDTAYQLAHTTEDFFEDGELKEMADFALKVSRGEISKEEAAEFTETDRYRDIYKRLVNLRKNMNANDIYVSVPDFNAEKSIIYIMDSYIEEDKCFNLGDASALPEKFKQISMEAYKTGVPTTDFLESKSEFGHNTTASYPVVYEGKTIAFINVEIPMTTLEPFLRNFFKSMAIFSAILMIVVSLVGYYTSKKSISKPIKTVAEEAKKFITNKREVSEILNSIKTGDEIEDLSKTFYSLENEINEYIDNLQKVTTEKERISTELNVATNIQAEMLPIIFPAFPERKDFDIYASMTPAKEVGGDFYDFFFTDENHLAMVMADVSGKGVPAALFMVIAKTLIKNRTQMGEASPSAILSDVSENLCEGNKSEFFVTVWLAIFDLSTGKGIAANAGHEHPVIKRSDGMFEIVKYRHSPALAVLPGITFREHEFEMQPGDVLFVYTDGVVEATDKNDELFGEERMLKALNENIDCSMMDLLPNIKKEIDDFVGEAPQFDDITMLGFEYYGPNNN